MMDPRHIGLSAAPPERLEAVSSPTALSAASDSSGSPSPASCVGSPAPSARKLVRTISTRETLNHVHNPPRNGEHKVDWKACSQDLGVSERDLQIRWLQRCLPIILQPEHDVQHGHALCAVFVSFVGDECRMSHIYEGESSYSRILPTAVNKLGTWLYRSVNFLKYKRTADIDDLVFHGVDPRPASSRPWNSIFTTDHAGSQTWAQGAKKTSFLRHYSLIHHYEADVPYEEWDIALDSVIPPGDHSVNSVSEWDVKKRLDSLHDWTRGLNIFKVASPPLSNQEQLPSPPFSSSHRPILYLNTMNHLCGPADLNPQFAKKIWRQYPVFFGSRDDAEAYARTHVPTKSNLFRPFPSKRRMSKVYHSDIVVKNASADPDPVAQPSTPVISETEVVMDVIDPKDRS